MLYIRTNKLPPSVNAAYFEQVIQKGKRLVSVRTLTKDGRAYKRELTTLIATQYGPQLTWIRPNMPLNLSIRLSFPNLINKGWPATAATKYKKLDASNRIKLLEDALVDALGVDDSQFLSVSVSKIIGEETTEVWVWSAEPTPAPGYSNAVF